jgi:predicted TIM-barrel fold metal-dependent hydrolase
MGRNYQVISADGHLETPPAPWLKHVPDRYKDRAPRLVELEDGGQGWLVEGMGVVANGVNLTGDRPMQFSNVSYWNADGTSIPGTGGPEQRLAEQDRDGTDAEVLYPPVFSFKFFENIKDRRVYIAMIRAYNDFLAEFCSVAPDRLLGTGMIPSTGIDDAIAELEYCSRLGLRAVCPSRFPNGRGTCLSAEDDRFWGRALELGMALAPHGGIGDRLAGIGVSSEVVASVMVGAPPRANAIAHSVQYGPLWGIIQLISAGTFDRFPDMRIYFAETEAGWLPFQLFAMDEAWRRRKHLYESHPNPLQMKPSEYVRRHVLFGMVTDVVAMTVRDYLPVDNLMWGTDFPHSAGTFPDSRGWLDRIFRDAPAEVRRKITLETPAKFFGLDLDADLTETPALAHAV